MRTYPRLQALALPLHKDKQRKACPRQVIYTYTTASTRQYTHISPAQPFLPIAGRHAYTLLYYIRNVKRRDIIITYVDVLCCITAVCRFKFAKFEDTASNVRKRPFETGRTTALGLVPSMFC